MQFPCAICERRRLPVVGAGRTPTRCLDWLRSIKHALCLRHSIQSASYVHGGETLNLTLHVADTGQKRADPRAGLSHHLRQLSDLLAQIWAGGD